MLRRTSIPVIVAALMAVGVTVAAAASVHYKGDQAFTDNGLTLTQSGQLSGLGNVDTLITIAATGQPTATCTNPGNGVHQPPGQNPATVTLTGSLSIPASEIKNGNLSFTVTTNPPVSPIAGAPECPNASWVEDITDVSFSSAAVTVAQGASVTALGGCTFSPSTATGAVPSGTVSCPRRSRPARPAA
jgi:hypothetical protein